MIQSSVDNFRQQTNNLQFSVGHLGVYNVQLVRNSNGELHKFTQVVQDKDCQRHLVQHKEDERKAIGGARRISEVELENQYYREKLGNNHSDLHLL